MQTPGSPGWQKLCEPDPQGRTTAMPVPGAWQGDRFVRAAQGFSFACTAGARGKCLRLGYLPWNTAPAGESMAPYHAACIRMMRADYCGDGTPHTVMGRQVEVFDRAGLLARTDPGFGAFEAAWGPDGAVCIAHVRVPAFSLEDVLRACPRLAAAGPCTEEAVGTLPGALLGRFPALRDLRRRAVAPRAEDCTREQCASEPACPFGRRRAALARAQLVVANHDLLLRWPPDYPNFAHVVADEAHELAGVADEAYATELRPEALFERLDELFGGPARRAPPLLSPRTGGDPLVGRGELLQELRALGRELAPRASEFAEVQLPPHAPRILPEAATVASRAAARLDDIAQLAADLDAERGADDAVSEQIGRGVGELRDAAEALRAAFGEDDAVVAAFEGLVDPFDRWRMALRQVSPAGSFHGHLLDKLEAFACVSASLFVSGDPFAALGELEVETREAVSWRAVLESPFPYTTHMRAVALADRGDPVELTTAVLADLARSLGGRTLGLFTSLRRMREVSERLAELLRPDGIEVWMPRRATDDPGALVDRFRRAGGGGVLLGSRTFWQGIAVPRPALEAVVIEKLPFEVPTELRRRREARVRDAGGDAFERYTLGKMLLNLKQMVGRLIRSEDDRGIVVVVDPRRDRPYFERLSAALPPGCGFQIASRAELPALIAELGLGGREKG